MRRACSTSVSTTQGTRPDRRGSPRSWCLHRGRVLVAHARTKHWEAAVATQHVVAREALARIMRDLFVCALRELEERDHVHAEVAVAERLADVRQAVLPRVVQVEHAATSPAVRRAVARLTRTASRSSPSSSSYSCLGSRNPRAGGRRAGRQRAACSAQATVSGAGSVRGYGRTRLDH
jgi:hypothetical protein